MAKETSSKYYVPKIEEFYIGFEYEYQVRDKTWIKNKLAYEDCMSDYSGEYDKSSPYPYWNKLRVKYLDKEDIVACGWKYKNNDYYIMNKHDLIFLPKENYSVNIFDNFDYLDSIFTGRIKNKSELIKVMEMLEIRKDKQ